MKSIKMRELNSVGRLWRGSQSQTPTVAGVCPTDRRGQQCVQRPRSGQALCERQTVGKRPGM